MSSLFQDLRFAMRSLRRSPGFFLVAVLTLALGIGANTSIYSLVHHVLFKPFPFLDTERLVTVWEVAPQGNDHNELAPGNFREWRQQNKSFQYLVAHAWATANLSGNERPERVQAFRVSPDFFEALGMRPVFGRGFKSGEDVVGNDKVAVITYGLWKRRYGSDSNIVGRSILVNGIARQVVGVLAEGQRYPTAAEMYIPMAMSEETWAGRGAHYLLATGVLKKGVTREQAFQELTGFAKADAAQYPESNANRSANVRPLVKDSTRQIQPVLLVLLGAVFFVLLIACANVANLQLARGVRRQQEMHVCAALGASGWRLARSVLLESVVLAVCGGGLGVLFAFWGLDALIALVPPQHVRFVTGLDRVSIDGVVLAFTLVLAIFTALLFGILPSWRAARVSNIEGMLRAGARSIAGARHRARTTLVAAEVGIALVLLVGAGLMVRAFSTLANRDVGIETDRTALLTITLPRTKYADSTQTLAFWNALSSKAAALPGVTSVGLSSIVPLCSCNSTTSFEVVGAPPFERGKEPDVGERIVNSAYLATLGVTMLHGRQLSDDDRLGQPRVVVVNATLERRFFPDGALGKRLRIGGDTAAFEIVGVAKDMRHGGAASEPSPEMFEPVSQVGARELSLIVRSATADPSTLIAPMRKIVSELDPDLPVFDVTTMKEMHALSVGPLNLSMRLLGMMAVLALVLATVGINSVVSQLVAERTREIGIRMALGGNQVSVIRYVMRRGLMAVFTGLSFGLVASFMLGQVVRKQIQGITATDPLTYVGMSLVLLTAAALAAWFPARVAARVNPIIALRAE